MITLNANFSAIEKQAKKLQGFGKAFLPKATKVTASLYKKKINLCFEQARSPYGQNWRATLAGNKPLSGSGVLKRSVVVRVSGTQIKISSGVVYAGVHQFGATINAKNDFLTFRAGNVWARKTSVTIPARPFLPDRGMPSAWANELNDELLILANDLLA